MFVKSTLKKKHASPELGMVAIEVNSCAIKLAREKLVLSVCNNKSPYLIKIGMNTTKVWMNCGGVPIPIPIPISFVGPLQINRGIKSLWLHLRYLLIITFQSEFWFFFSPPPFGNISFVKQGQLVSMNFEFSWFFEVLYPWILEIFLKDCHNFLSLFNQ